MRTLRCPRCRELVNHKLIDYKNLIYKCTKCGNVHYETRK